MYRTTRLQNTKWRKHSGCSSSQSKQMVCFFCLSVSYTMDQLHQSFLVGCNGVMVSQKALVVKTTALTMKNCNSRVFFSAFRSLFFVFCLFFFFNSSVSLSLFFPGSLFLLMSLFSAPLVSFLFLPLIFLTPLSEHHLSSCCRHYDESAADFLHHEMILAPNRDTVTNRYLVTH